MTPLKVFVSYSHLDEPFLAQLEKHLASLKREGLIATWHDRRIVPGDEWERAIEDALQNSDIYIFLISPDFIASEYCIDKEVAVALEKHKNKKATVIPLVVRPSDWLSTPLGKIQGLPKDANPISLWQDVDQAWLEVVRGIRTAISDITQRRGSDSPDLELFSISEALLSVVEQIEQRYSDNRLIGGLGTGLHDLDLLIDGIHAGDLVYVASAPAVDRFAFLVSVINHVAVEQGQAAIIFSLRKSKDYVARRLCAALGGIPAHAIQRGELQDNDWSRMTYALGRLNEAKLGFVETQSIDINSLISQIDAFREINGSGYVVVIDSLDFVSGGNKPALLSILGRYARNHKISIIVADGLVSDPALRVSRRPVLRDIGEWAALDENIDIILLVYQDDIYNPDSADRGLVELIVAKNQRGGLGDISVAVSKGHGLENLKSSRRKRS